MTRVNQRQDSLEALATTLPLDQPERLPEGGFRPPARRGRPPRRAEEVADIRNMRHR